MSNVTHIENHRNNSDENSSDSAASSDIEKLRSILTQPERDDIKQLNEQVAELQFRTDDTDTRAADVSEILAQASKLSHRNNEKFGDSLKPIIVEQFQNSSRENPEIMAEALFPILGPAIRKMIASMLSLDSKKSKRAYKFEQIFLIEKESGIPICHSKADSAEAQDADMVSGMLSAIQSFVQDAFSTQEFDSLNTLQLGGLSVWIEWGPNAVIAAVIRGVAPENCRSALQHLLEDIHSDYGDELANYDGDSSAFTDIETDFDLFMDNHDSRFRNRVRNMSQRSRRNFGIAAIAFACFAFWAFSNQADKRKWAEFVSQVDAQPGIVITAATRQDGTYTLRGLKDPLADDPIKLLAATSLDPDNVVIELEPYRAMHPQFTLQRLQAVLVPPSGVSLELDGETLRIHGAKPSGWLQDAKRLSRQFPEISYVTVE